MVTVPAIEHRTFLRRLVGVAMLDPATFEEIEADRTATRQAIAVVLLSSVSAGLVRKASAGADWCVVFFSAVALMAWAAWSLVYYQIGVGSSRTPIREPMSESCCGRLASRPRRASFVSWPRARPECRGLRISACGCSRR